MEGEIDLDAYFSRIGFEGAAPPTLETLARIHELHARAIPFESLAAFIGEDIPLDAQSLQAKLVRSGRGGWCFEQNLLFSHVLRALGFELSTLAARVRWNVPAGTVRARTHMVIRVKIDARDYIADVGFGGQTLTAPLRLETGIEQPTPHERFRLSEIEPKTYLLESEIAGAWQPLYAFDLVEHVQADYELSNWYLSHHPQSLFVSDILAARSDTGLRHTLRGGRYAIHRKEGTESRPIESVEDYRKLLSGPFRIRLPENDLLDRKLAQLVDRSRSA
jgi:N-hydroxyarylamine O-acetyltransferase